MVKQYLYLLYNYTKELHFVKSLNSFNGHPHIIKFTDDNKDITPQYFIGIVSIIVFITVLIGVEQSLLCEYTSLVTALFHLVVVHYVFNIELVVHLTHEVI